jgi:hypothetical protein
MDNSSFLILGGNFEIFGKNSYFIVEFLKNEILIKDQQDPSFNNINDANPKTVVKYVDILKIKYSSTNLKIILKNEKKIKIACNSVDLKKIKTLFKITEEPEYKDINASAMVSVGDYSILVLINSTDIKELKIGILKRLAKHLYPACETEGITLEMFKKFKFIVLIDEIEIELRHSEDLKAALNYFENKLKIRMIKGDDDF